MPDAKRSAGRRPSVLILPYISANPYQDLLAGALRDRGIGVRLAESRGGIGSLMRAWLRAGCPRVVHLHWVHHFLDRHGAKGDLEARTFLGQLDVLRALGVRIIWTLHNLGGHESGKGADEQQRHRELVRRCDVVIAHCPAAIDMAIDTYGLGPDDRRRFRVIPHGSYVGVYPDRLDRAAARQKLGLPSDAVVFLALGAVREYKGLDGLIQAFRTLDAPNARLLIAGKPRGKPIVERLQRLAVGDQRISLRMVRIPDDDLSTYLRAADVAALPYKQILTSGSAILALGFGLPVIAPSLGCLPGTVAADAGIQYDPADTDGLAGALRTALGADLAAMGARAQESMRDHDWPTIIGPTVAAYRGEPEGR